MIVVDASALVAALTDDGPVGQRARATLRHDPDWAAPSYLLVETVANIRKLLLAGKITLKRAEDAVHTCVNAVIDEVPTQSLIPRAWALRGNVSGYDAFYVAVAEHYGVALVTADHKLGKASGINCPVLPV